MKRAEKIDKKDRLLYGGIAALLAILIIYVFTKMKSRPL